jgi:predicted secreted hydrolase
MEMEGDLITGGETEHFSGSAWMDREFGTWDADGKSRKAGIGFRFSSTTIAN